MNILCISHVSETLGLGHLSRLLAVAGELRKFPSLQLKFLLLGDTIRHATLERFSHQFVSNLAELNKVITTEQFSVAVIDVDFSKIPESFLQTLMCIKEKEVKLVGIGAGGYESFWDVAHLPAFYVPEDILKKYDCPVDYGWDSYLLPEPIPFKKLAHSKKKLLILTGGSDVAKLSRLWPKLLDESLPQNIEPHWVRGPYADKPDLPEDTRLDWKVHFAPQPLDELMSQADFALTVFGVSFFELLNYAVPTAVFSPYGAKHKLEIDRLKESQVALVSSDANIAISHITDLVQDKNLASQFVANARKKLTGSGARDLARRIADLAL